MNTTDTYRDCLSPSVIEALEAYVSNNFRKLHDVHRTAAARVAAEAIDFVPADDDATLWNSIERVVSAAFVEECCIAAPPAVDLLPRELRKRLADAEEARGTLSPQEARRLASRKGLARRGRTLVASFLVLVLASLAVGQDATEYEGNVLVELQQADAALVRLGDYARALEEENGKQRQRIEDLEALVEELTPVVDPPIGPAPELTGNLLGDVDFEAYGSEPSLVMYQHHISPTDALTWDANLVDAWLEERVPEDWSGVLCLDWEGQAMKSLKAGALDPNFDDVLSEWVSLLAYVRAARPSALVGYYGMPIREIHNQGPEWLAAADAYAPILQGSSCLFPSVYPSSPSDISKRGEAFDRIVALAAGLAPDRPIVAFVMRRYHASNAAHGAKTIDADVYRGFLARMLEAGADGLFLWSGDPHYYRAAVEQNRPGTRWHRYRSAFAEDMDAGESFDDFTYRRTLENLQLARDALSGSEDDPPPPPLTSAPDWYDVDDYPVVGAFSVTTPATGAALNMRSLPDGTRIVGEDLGRLDGWRGDPPGPVLTGLVLDRCSVSGGASGNTSALHRFCGDFLRFAGCDFIATNYAVYAHNDPMTRAVFDDCDFREVYGGDKVEANVRVRDGERLVFRDCVNVKSVRQHNDGADYLKSAWRFYRTSKLWIDGGRTVGSFRIGSDNSPDSAGECSEIWISNHTIEHPGLYAPGHGSPGWAIELGDEGDVSDLTLVGVEITSPNTQHAIVATAPCAITLEGCVFNGEPMTLEHVRWRIAG